MKEDIKKLSHRSVLFFLMITPLFLLLQLGVGIFIYNNLQNISKSEDRDNKIDTYLRTNTKYIAHAESAQRGYLLTGDHKYLDTYKSDLEEQRKNEEYYGTLPADFKSLAIEKIRLVSKNKLDEMASTIILYQAGDKDSSLNIVKEGTGKLLMDTLRKSSTELRDNITRELTDKKSGERFMFMFFLGLIGLLIFFNLFLVFYTYNLFNNYTQNLEKLVDSLESANEKMTKYTSMSYHELKTPLRGISGFAQLLKKKFDHQLDGEEKEYVQYITDNTKQLEKIINDMRDKYLSTTKEDLE